MLRIPENSGFCFVTDLRSWEFYLLTGPMDANGQGEERDGSHLNAGPT